MPTDIEMPTPQSNQGEAPKRTDAGFSEMMASIKKVLNPPDPKQDKPKEEAPKTPEEPPKEEAKTPQEEPKQEKEETPKDQPKDAKPKVSGIEQLRKEYESAKAEKLRLEQEIKTLKEKKPPEVSMDELDKLRRERDDALQIVKRVDRQKHPEFKREFIEPLQSIIKKARQYVPAESHGALEAILNSPASEQRLAALESIIEPLSGARQSEIMRLADSAQDIISRRESALSEADGWFQEQQRRDADSARDKWKREKEAWEHDFESVGREASEAIEIFQFKAGDEDHNRLVTQRVEKVKALLFGDNSRRRQVESAFAAIAAEEAVPLLARSRAEIAKLEETLAAKDKELEELRTKRPGLSSPIKAQTQPKDMMSAINAALKGE